MGILNLSDGLDYSLKAVRAVTGSHLLLKKNALALRWRMDWTGIKIKRLLNISS